MTSAAQWTDIDAPFDHVSQHLRILNNSLVAYPTTIEDTDRSDEALAISNAIKTACKAYDHTAITIEETLAVLGPPSNEEAADSCPGAQKSAALVLNTLSLLGQKKTVFQTNNDQDGFADIKQQINHLKESVDRVARLWTEIAPADYKSIPVDFQTNFEVAIEELTNQYQY